MERTYHGPGPYPPVQGGGPGPNNRRLDATRKIPPPISARKHCENRRGRQNDTIFGSLPPLRIWVSVPRQKRTHNRRGARRKESAHGVVKGGEGAGRAEAAGPHPRPRGRAPRGPDGRRQELGQIPCSVWLDDNVVLPMLAAPPLPSPASQPQPSQPSQPLALQPPKQPPPPPKQQQRSETFSEQVLVTPGGSRGHKLKRTSPGGTTQVCALHFAGRHSPAAPAGKN